MMTTSFRIMGVTKSNTLRPRQGYPRRDRPPPEA